MKTFNILKKNKKYFSATTDGYKCKILIDEASKDLEVGKAELEVEDISIRSKYGTDLIFKLKASVYEQKEAGICTLQHYTINRKLVEKCKNLGGTWDSETKAWIFSGLVLDKIEELDVKFNSPLVGVEVIFKNGASGYREGIYLCGILLARAFGRDSGAKLGEGISLISGKIDSGGSVKNWLTKIHPDTTFRLYMPEKLLDEIDLDCEIKRL